MDGALAAKTLQRSSVDQLDRGRFLSILSFLMEGKNWGTESHRNGLKSPPQSKKDTNNTSGKSQISLFTVITVEFEIFIQSRPIARIQFSWEGGGEYLKKGDQIFNVVMIRYESSEETQGRVSNLRTNWNGDKFLSPIKAWVNVVAHRKNTFFAITRQVYNRFCSFWYQIAQWKKFFDIGINIWIFNLWKTKIIDFSGKI